MADRRRQAYVQRINRVLDYVADHLDGDLTVDALARVAAFSPFHFHRIFRAMVGETVHQHVNRVRLERAASLLRAAPRARATDVALAVGFAGISELSRAWKKRYGLRLTDWDRVAPLQKSKDGQAPHGMPRYGADELRARAAELGFGVVTRRLPRCRFVYLRMHDSYSGIDKLQRAYADVTGWLATRGIDLDSAAVIGMSIDDPDVTPLERCRYDLGAAFALGADGGALDALLAARARATGRSVDRAELPAIDAAELEARGLSVRDLGPCELSMLRCTGDIHAVDVAWRYLYHVWLPESDCEPAGIPAMELFVQLPSDIGWDRWDEECALPITRMQT